MLLSVYIIVREVSVSLLVSGAPHLGTLGLFLLI